MIQFVKISIGILVLSVLLPSAYIQIPREVPHPSNNSPIDLSKPEDVIIYIVLPVVVIILLLIGRRRRKTKE